MHSYNSTLVVPAMSFEMVSDATMASSGNKTDWCAYYKEKLVFDSIQMWRVIIMWILFLISSCGNCFVLYCLWMKKRRSHVHIITLHLTLADLAFTLFTIPTDAVWNVTMAWLGGEALCKIAQMLKQFGMYISSFMVVVIGLDRVCSILAPMSSIPTHKRRTKVFLAVAWTISILCSIPPAVLFSLVIKVFCEDEPPFTQCVDFKVVAKEHLHPYYFFTMMMSFILPLVIAVISYSLILYEMKNMQERDRNMRGRKGSTSGSSIAKARKKTMILTSMVTATFVLLWGPYYGFGMYIWFEQENARQIPKTVSMWLMLPMYVHPSVHPFMYGIFMKDVRKRFIHIVTQISSCFSCERTLKSKTLRTPTISVKRSKRSSLNRCRPCSKMDFLSFCKMQQTPEFKTNSTPYSSTRTSHVALTDDHLLNVEPFGERNRNLFLSRDAKCLDHTIRDEKQHFINVNQKSVW